MNHNTEYFFFEAVLYGKFKFGKSIPRILRINSWKTLEWPVNQGARQESLPVRWFTIQTNVKTFPKTEILIFVACRCRMVTIDSLYSASSLDD
ncbi:MAG: hypothetical protein AAGA75_06975 [Cyanobacteria bacterium P01_E01_bin.6]